MGTIIATPIVIDSFASGAADITYANNRLVISGKDTNGNALAVSLYYPGGSASGGIKSNIVETPYTTTIMPLATASTLCGFVITQYNPQTTLWQPYVFQTFNPASGATATTVGDLLRKQINAVNVANGAGSLNVTVSGTTTVILTGGTGNVLFNVTLIGDCTGGTSGMYTTAAATLSDASPAVLGVGTTHLTTGQIIALSGSVYMANPSPNGLYQVTTTGASTSTLTWTDGVTAVNGDGSHNETGITVTLQQNDAYGTYAQIVAANVLALAGQPVAGQVYDTLLWNGVFPDAPLLTTGQNTLFKQKVYFKVGGTNVAAALVQLTADFNTLSILA